MRLNRAFLLVVMAAWLNGCAMSGLLGGNSAPATFDLQAPIVEKRGSARGPHLAINTPVAIRTIDTDEILVRTGGQLAYFPGAAWGDRLPKLFQARLVETFANAGVFRAVVTNQDRVAGDLSLAIEIRDFQINVNNGQGAQAVIDVFVKLVNERGGSVIGSKRFSATVASQGDDVVSGVVALNTAFQTVAADILHWTSGRRGMA